MEYRPISQMLEYVKTSDTDCINIAQEDKALL